MVYGQLAELDLSAHAWSLVLHKSIMTYTHIKSRVEVTPEVELFPNILDNTGWCYYFSSFGGAKNAPMRAFI